MHTPHKRWFGASFALAFMLALLSCGVCAAQALDAQQAASATELAIEREAPDETWRASSAKPLHWYGWQTLTADFAALGVTALGLFMASDSAGNSLGWALIVPGLLAYTVVTPLLHGSRDNSWWLGSAVLRGAALTATVVGTVNVARCIGDETTCWDDLAIPLFLLGPVLAVVATTLDALLAFEHRYRTALRWTPWADPGTAAAGLSLNGRW